MLRNLSKGQNDKLDKWREKVLEEIYKKVNDGEEPSPKEWANMISRTRLEEDMSTMEVVLKDRETDEELGRMAMCELEKIR